MDWKHELGTLGFRRAPGGRWVYNDGQDRAEVTESPELVTGLVRTFDQEIHDACSRKVANLEERRAAVLEAARKCVDIMYRARGRKIDRCSFCGRAFDVPLIAEDRPRRCMQCVMGGQGRRRRPGRRGTYLALGFLFALAAGSGCAGSYQEGKWASPGAQGPARTAALTTEESSSCEDSLYLALRTRPMSELSDREYQYLLRAEDRRAQARLGPERVVEKGAGTGTTILAVLGALALIGLLL